MRGRGKKQAKETVAVALDIIADAVSIVVVEANTCHKSHESIWSKGVPQARANSILAQSEMQ